MPNLDVVRNPIAFIAARWTPTQRTLRRATLAPLVMSVVIVVTGGAVRLTGSGLGCDTWPKCSDDSLVATSEMGLHGAIEFGNRMLTYVLSAAVGWAIIATRSAKPRRRNLSRLAWAQFWVVMANGVIGGITVLTELNPYTVAGHFLAATGLLTITTLTWLRAREGDEPPRRIGGTGAQRISWALTAMTGALIVGGTVVTGTGPHAGDSSEVPRMPGDWASVARLHSALAWAVVLLTVALWVALRRSAAAGEAAGAEADRSGEALARRRTVELFVVLLAQGAIGYVQYLTELPELLVGIHLLGSCLVWVATLRAVLSLRHRGVAAASAREKAIDAPDPSHAAGHPGARKDGEADDATDVPTSGAADAGAADDSLTASQR